MNNILHNRLWKPIDSVCIASLTIIAMAISFLGSGMVGTNIIRMDLHNIWFDADTSLVFNDMRALFSYHRTSKHPLFFLLTFPFVKSLAIVGLDPWFSVRLYLAASAGIWIALIYLIFKFSIKSTISTFTFTNLALVSSSFIFWSTVPETFILGSTSILVAILLIASIDYLREKSFDSILLSRITVVVSAFTLGITITNWIAGLVATFSLHSWRKGIKVSLAALIIVVSLALLQWKFLSTTGLFFSPDNLKKEISWADNTKTEAGGISNRWRSIFLHSVIMPEIEVRKIDNLNSFSIQSSSIGSASKWGYVGVLLWIGNLALGSLGLLLSRKSRRLSICLILILITQLFLHSIYGVETFLFSAHFGILLIILSSFSTFTRFRTLALGTTWLLILITFTNNINVFQTATRILNQY